MQTLVAVDSILGFGHQIWRIILRKSSGLVPTDGNKTKKCHFWQWVDKDKGTEPIELKLSILENDFNVYNVKTNKECVSFIKELGQMRRNLWIHKCCIIMLFVLFVVIVIM